MIHRELDKPSLPPITEGPFTLTFARGERAEFAMLLAFPGPHSPYYPISSYARLADFRAMLGALVPSSQPVAWTGDYFVGHAQPSDQAQAEIWFRAPDNGITFFFSRDEWATVRRLFQRAWDSPHVQQAWAHWTDDYHAER